MQLKTLILEKELLIKIRTDIDWMCLITFMTMGFVTNFLDDFDN